MKTIFPAVLVPAVLLVLASAGCNRETTPRAGEDISLSTNSAVIPPEADGPATTPVTMPPAAEAAARCVAFTGNERAACEAAASKVEGVAYEVIHDGSAAADVNARAVEGAAGAGGARPAEGGAGEPQAVPTTEPDEPAAEVEPPR